MLSLAVLVACSHAIELDSSHPELMELSQRMDERRRGMEWPNEFSQADKDDILALHNKIRAETARGEYIAAASTETPVNNRVSSAGNGKGKMPKANNMVKLKWSDTLAEVASEWAEEICEGGARHRDNEPNYPSCQSALSAFSSHDIPYVGDGCGETAQGSSYTWATWSTNARGDEDSVKAGLQSRMSIAEGQAYTPSGTDLIYGNNYGHKCSLDYCSHYTQIVWAETRYVGCGWRSCSTSTSKYRFVCNYYPSGNIGSLPIYGTGGNIGSKCPSGYTKSSASSSYTDQDGENYDLGKLCVADDEDPNGGGTSSECCSGCTSKTECSASQSCNSNVCSVDSWCCNSGWDATCTSLASDLCDSDTSSNGGGDDTPCIVVDGWGDSKYGQNIDFDYGQWIQDSNTPIDDNGYIVYKHTLSDFYLYTLPDFKEYTFSETVNEKVWPKGWCGATTDDVTDCSGLWWQASNIKFYNCGEQPFIAEPCFDDAAELVRFLLDEDEVDEYMQFDLHSDVGCWNEEPVWLLEDENEGENATLHFLHYNVGAARGVGAWQITADYVEGDVVYWCDEEALSDCTAGTWKELNVSYIAAGVNLDENVLATATVTLGASADDGAGLSETDDVAIALVALLVVGVVGVVALLWCRARRNKGQVEVGFEDADEIEVEQMQTEDNTTR